MCSLLTSDVLPRHVQYRYKRQLQECERVDVELAHIDSVLQQVQAQLRIQTRNQSEDEKPNIDEQKFYVCILYVVFLLIL